MTNLTFVVAVAKNGVIGRDGARPWRLSSDMKRVKPATMGKPLGRLAAASTFWIIFCLPLAYAASLLRIEFFFPAMLLIIGERCLTFGALYGVRPFRLLGIALAGAGFIFGWSAIAPLIAVAAGASIELIFVPILFVLHARWRKTA